MFKITWKTQVTAMALSLAIVVPLFWTLINCYINLFIEVYNINSSLAPSLLAYIFLLALMLAISVIHELIHGAVFTTFGGKVKYGFKKGTFYTMDISARPIKRVKFLIVLLSPIITFSIIPFAFKGWIPTLIFIFNLIGSTGDILMAFSLCKLKETDMIVEWDYGYSIVSN